MDQIATFTLSLSDVFGPYELINFTRHGPYADVILEDQKSGMSKGAVTGIVLGSIAGLIAISLIMLFIFYKRKSKHKQEVSKKQSIAKIPIKAASVKGFSFTELEKATRGFSESSLVGQGGYGKVYKGILDNGTAVAIKRAQQGSLQGGEQVNSACQSGNDVLCNDNGMGPYSSECLRRFMALALKCCEDETERRPSMLEVVRELENVSSMLPESETIPTDSDISASRSSGIPTSSLYSGRNSYVSGDFPEAGSDLVSGVVPTIRPR
ncbi:hypothetical protein Patl1_31605 [Pistacia atlantica]|uniref:Uncharacterized protein n=1 Tax=Pistacia atlantica TaxID=434234 RepID=A0ACC1ARJ6_9ROSI|nr:hypothetical protein Patl1_31605 [Pistacia atlantica]